MPTSSQRTSLRSRTWRTCGVVLSALLTLSMVMPVAHSKVIHSERSLYRNILVTEVSKERCLKFSHKRVERNQSCKDLRNPQRLVFPYARMMISSLLLVEPPERVLLVGLGGGTLVEALRSLLPNTHIDIVEIDAAVVDVAEQFFDFQKDEHMAVFETDGRVFVKRQLRAGATYDLIMLDAFGGDYIPEHLMTREFLTEIGQLLAPGGVVAANTFASSALYLHESATWHAVFGTFINLRSNVSLNRIILASNDPLPSQEELKQRAARMAPRFSPLHVPLREMPGRMSREQDWPADTRILTDQYAPANLLR